MPIPPVPPARPLGGAAARTMRSLGAQQRLFAKLIGQLIQFVYSNDGWELSFGDAYRPDHLGHMKNSTHYIRLAVDFNLFVDGVWKDRDCPEWRCIGAFWKALHSDCRWGGDFKQVDANHLSMQWGGVA